MPKDVENSRNNRYSISANMNGYKELACFPEMNPGPVLQVDYLEFNS
jgi:hypothetical protein